MTVSILDEVPGVGPTRKKALRKAFGSMRRLREATLEQIEAVPGIPAQVAREVYDTLRAWDAELERGRDDADVSRGDATSGPDGARHAEGEPVDKPPAEKD